ncbi:CSC1-like protein At1g69450 isoform X4 [Diospyros lotus]|uniref:CSC1-like protein At1g69450 isoform X4 n=1 Tax=Diospyros lotus TaxID=55363 RepID=UPI0022542F0F|nr:CSC1-like protein At1g69450 isoform X4 [Diospyros lotus]
MIVSALLTSLGINFGLCILFFTLYSVLRKQPSNYEVYMPRLLADGLSQQRRFNLQMLLPTPGWVRRAWQPSEEEMLASAGLDAVVFMRIIILSLRIFCVAGIIGIFVLLPVNCTGNQLASIDFANLTSDSLDVFSISNVNNGSNKLWIHFSAVYIVTVFICCLLYYEYRYISSKRVTYFHSSKPQPHQFTILVRSIPVSVGISVSDSVERFFTQYHPSTYLSHVVVHRTGKIRNLISNTKKLYKRLIHFRTESPQSKFECGGCCGLFPHKGDLLEQYEKKFEDSEENLRLEQSDTSSAGEEVRAAFVSFKSRYGAATAFHMQQSVNPTQWLTEKAPEPHDVYWPFFSSSFMGRWISKLLVVLACISLTVLFIIPVLFVQGLANLAQLEVWFPFLKSILSITFVSQVITGYLPSLILLLFLKMAPPIMKFLSSIQGYISNSEIEKSACDKVLWFTIWNVFFGNVLSGSVFTQISILLEPKKIPAMLAVSVPAQASFCIAYVVTSGWTSVATELFRMIPFICSLISKPCVRSSDDEVEVPSLPYHKDIPRLLLFGLFGITYFFLAPLIVPFLLIYFCLAYIIYRNQFINVYAPKYETAGKYWPIVHHLMIFSLVLMHAIALGIFTLKKLPLASTLIIPLPVLTLLFNAYCSKRFLPIFTAYSAETLIKKDREDHNDATMAEFFARLETAYFDPALLPIQYSTNYDSRTSPLLPSTEV